ncbi:hypothetical protein PAXRUDRAFT_26242 [Paxillus rubicundulus Ve08.2h10]|uniref:Uncharacterized protein n=1 Tax=Paxillus rubicundulus Ve08.2h10 TaxID=930991 RepID=A0A0D0E702_9AGAM|nr:hypothetical protein PAXRUDRAFT_26242 [Paxillus rubicundulus Ve08.2h10]
MKYVSRKFIDFVLYTTSNWANWDPPLAISHFQDQCNQSQYKIESIDLKDPELQPVAIQNSDDVFNGQEMSALPKDERTTSLIKALPNIIGKYSVTDVMSCPYIQPKLLNADVIRSERVENWFAVRQPLWDPLTEEDDEEFVYDVVRSRPCKSPNRVIVHRHEREGEQDI